MKKISLFLLLSLYFGNAFSQRAISLTSPKGKKTWLINAGDVVAYEVKNNHLGYFKGIVEEVKDSSVIISGEEIKFSLLSMIKAPRNHAGRSIFIGLCFGGLSYGLYDYAARNEEEIPASPDAVAITVGVLGAAGLYYILKGVVELAVPHKCYVSDGWKIESVSIAQLKKEG